MLLTTQNMFSVTKKLRIVQNVQSSDCVNYLEIILNISIFAIVDFE